MSYLLIASLFIACCGGIAVALSDDYSEVGITAKYSGYVWIACAVVLALVDFGIQMQVIE